MRVGQDAKDGAVWSLAFSPDGKSLAIGTYGEAVLWDLARQVKTASFENVCSALAVAFAGDGKTLAVGTAIDGIQLWDLATTTKTASLGKRADGMVNRVAFAADGKSLASVASRAGSKLWDVPGRKERAAFKKEEKVACVVFAPDGKGVATGNRDGVVKVWKRAE
jgi:WD40 repeat protein